MCLLHFCSFFIWLQSLQDYSQLLSNFVTFRISVILIALKFSASVTSYKSHFALETNLDYWPTCQQLLCSQPAHACSLKRWCLCLHHIVIVFAQSIILQNTWEATISQVSWITIVANEALSKHAVSLSGIICVCWPTSPLLTHSVQCADLWLCCSFRLLIGLSMPLNASCQLMPTNVTPPAHILNIRQAQMTFFWPDRYLWMCIFSVFLSYPTGRWLWLWWGWIMRGRRPRYEESKEVWTLYVFHKCSLCIFIALHTSWNSLSN